MAAGVIHWNRCLQPIIFPTRTRILLYNNVRRFSSLKNFSKLNVLGRSFWTLKSNRHSGDAFLRCQTTRHMSSGEELKDSPVFSEPDAVATIAEQISSAEPSLSSLGLGGYSPIGLVQQVMEYIHVGASLPWWATIITTTLFFRTLMIPFVIRAQANAVKMNNIKPELDAATQKMREAANMQDSMKQAEATRNLKDLYQKHDCHPFKSLGSIFVQLPVFLSFFLGLRQMANLPVESMKTGGLLWFPNLTIADPYFLLPIFCSASMLLTIEAGAEAGVSNPQFKNIKHFFRFLAIMMIPLTAKFPTAVFIYWMTSNAFSLAQMVFLRIERVRNFFGIPEKVDHSEAMTNSGGFIENFTAGFKNSQNLALIRHNEKHKQKAFEMASKQPFQQTYEKNPLAKSNEEIFKITNKQKKKRGSSVKDKYTTDM